jgi:hypothetical protein
VSRYVIFINILYFLVQYRIPIVDYIRKSEDRKDNLLIWIKEESVISKELFKKAILQAVMTYHSKITMEEEIV